MKIRNLQILAAAFALAMTPGPLANAHGGGGGGGWHGGGGGGWHGGGGWGWRGGGYYGGYYNPWWGDDPYWDYGYPYYGSTAPYPPAQSSASLATQVQQGLARDGYYSGPIDGIIGPMTRNAIARFQGDRGLAVTGRIDESLLQSLGLM